MKSIDKKCISSLGLLENLTLVRQFSSSLQRESTNDSNSQKTLEDYPMNYNKNSKKETLSGQTEVDKRQYDHYY